MPRGLDRALSVSGKLKSLLVLVVDGRKGGSAHATRKGKNPDSWRASCKPLAQPSDKEKFDTHHGSISLISKTLRFTTNPSGPLVLPR